VVRTDACSQMHLLQFKGTEELKMNLNLERLNIGEHCRTCGEGQLLHKVSWNSGFWAKLSLC